MDKVFRYAAVFLGLTFILIPFCFQSTATGADTETGIENFSDIPGNAINKVEEVEKASMDVLPEPAGNMEITVPAPEVDSLDIESDLDFEDDIIPEDQSDDYLSSEVEFEDDEPEDGEETTDLDEYLPAEDTPDIREELQGSPMRGYEIPLDLQNSPLRQFDIKSDLQGSVLRKYELHFSGKQDQEMNDTMRKTFEPHRRIDPASAQEWPVPYKKR